MPTFENGILAIPNAELTSVLLVSLDEAAGASALKITPQLPGASVLRILHATADKSGAVLSVAAKDDAGRYSCFLALSAADGSLSKYVQLFPYTAGRVTRLPDGRLLAIGREQDSSLIDIPNHHLLRFMGADGLLQKTALPVSNLISGERVNHPMNWLMARGADKLGLLNRDNNVYCEIDYEGRLVQPPAVLGIEPEARVTGLAILLNGDRLASLDIPRTKENGRKAYGVECRIVQVSGFGREVAVRSRADLLTEAARFVHVLGYWKGNAVLLARGPDRVLLMPA
ncbi:MAG: hypothetical protein IT162_11145 [Bryobacterales bacterium]|nr:hypothetical protein [Bryobacterales bacterium]